MLASPVTINPRFTSPFMYTPSFPSAAAPLPLGDGAVPVQVRVQRRNQRRRGDFHIPCLKLLHDIRAETQLLVASQQRPPGFVANQPVFQQ